MSCNVYYNNEGVRVVENNTSVVRPVRAPRHTNTHMRREICNYIVILICRHVETLERSLKATDG
jgi:hypothetical protein